MSTNYINQITDTGGTTHDIMEGVDTRIFRATCSTAAGTAAKVATLDDATNYSLAAGVRVAVTFTYGNSATTPTLNVNSGGAKTIVTPTAVATLTSGNGTTYNTWGPYETVIFTYNGTYWVKGGTGYSIYNAYALANSKTANTGTVTKVTAGTGLSIGSTSGGNFTTTGTINHTNSVTAATAGTSSATSGSTLAVPYVTYDAQGHITASGTHIHTISGFLTSSSTLDATKLSGTIPSSCYTDTNTHRPIQMNGTEILGDNTTVLNLKAGTGITLANSSGTVTITNSSTNTDTKVTTAALTSGTSYYPILATGTGTATRQIDSTLKGLMYKSTAGTTSTVGSAYLSLGNSTASGTANNEQGVLQIYSPSSYYTNLISQYNTGHHTISLPDEDGDLLVGALGFTTSGNNRAVLRNSNGQLYVTQTDTDTKVTQTHSTSTSYYRLLGSGSAGTGTGSTTTTTYMNQQIYMQPSTGNLYSSDQFFYISSTDDIYTNITNLGWASDTIVE